MVILGRITGNRTGTTSEMLFNGLHYRACGEGRPVILIHGVGANTFVWRYLVPILSSRFMVYVFDLKGHGKSEKPDDGRYSLRDHSGLFVDFIRHHDLREVALVGHSFGGGVALLVALRLIEDRDNRLSSIALIDSIGFRQHIPLYFRLLTIPLISAAVLGLLPAECLIRAALRDVYFDSSKIDAETVTAYASNLKSAEGRRALAVTARQLIRFDVESVIGRYRDIRLPILIIWGEHDTVVPPQFAAQFKAHFPHSDVVMIDRCGHNPQEERPEVVGPAMLAFLSGGG